MTPSSWLLGYGLQNVDVSLEMLALLPKAAPLDSETFLAPTCYEGVNQLNPQRFRCLETFEWDAPFFYPAEAINPFQDCAAVYTDNQANEPLQPLMAFDES